MAPTSSFTLVALALTFTSAAASGGCNRSPAPIAPESVPARGPGPAALPPAAEPPPPPKEAPANQAPDAPASPAAAAPQLEEKPPALAEEKPAAGSEKPAVTAESPAAPAAPVATPAGDAKTPPAAALEARGKGKVREIHPTEPGKGCVEMYGSCTKPPDPICTSSAFYLDCGQSGKVPNTGESVTCVCP